MPFKYILNLLVSVQIYELSRFCVRLMSEMLRCFSSKKDLNTRSGTLTYQNEKENHRKQKDEKQVVKMKSGELMSSKVKARKHKHQPVLTLF